MKVTIKNQVEKEKQIDWNKKNILIHKHNNDVILITNGEHDNRLFNATFINHWNHRIIGYFGRNFLKIDFKLPESPITLTFENE